MRNSREAVWLEGMRGGQGVGDEVREAVGLDSTEQSLGW